MFYILYIYSIENVTSYASSCAIQKSQGLMERNITCYYTPDFRLDTELALQSIKFNQMPSYYPQWGELPSWRCGTKCCFPSDWVDMFWGGLLSVWLRRSLALSLF